MTSSVILYLQNFIQTVRPDTSGLFCTGEPHCVGPSLWHRLSPRPISGSQLHMLPCFHPCPIHLVFHKGSCPFGGHPILRGASRLDAFSVYPVRTWPPCRASGETAGAPAVRPSRSSRTGDSPSQISCARAG